MDWIVWGRESRRRFSLVAGLEPGRKDRRRFFLGLADWPLGQGGWRKSFSVPGRTLATTR